jgi:hypothetical protein
MFLDYDAVASVSTRRHVEEWSLRATVFAVVVLSVVGWAAVVALTRVLI